MTRFATSANRQETDAGGGAATATAPLRITAQSEEVRLPFLEIVTTGDAAQVVTAIEVLSPINKRGEGRSQYVRKRNQVLTSGTSLLEIDLLRGGDGVCLHRAGSSDFDCWPIALRAPLPTVAVPLVDALPDFALDLQAAFTAVYDEGPFRRKVRYDGEPIPRLDAVDRPWADALLATKGLRPTS